MYVCLCKQHRSSPKINSSLSSTLASSDRRIFQLPVQLDTHWPQPHSQFSPLLKQWSASNWVWGAKRAPCPKWPKQTSWRRPWIRTRQEINCKRYNISGDKRGWGDESKSEAEKEDRGREKVLAGWVSIGVFIWWTVLADEGEIILLSMPPYPSLSLSFSRDCFSFSLFLSISLSLFHTHTHTHTHIRRLEYTHTLTNR